MKNMRLMIVLLLAGCASGPSNKAPPKPAPPPDEQKSALSGVTKASDTDETAQSNSAEVADEIVKCQMGGHVARPNATIRAGEYFNVQVRKPCDFLTVHAEQAYQVHKSLRAFDEARERLGGDNVKLVIGMEATVYRSREELLSDPAAGAEAAAVLPEDFNFETFALARYDVLHSPQEACRDQRLGMTGEQAKAHDAALQKWTEKARRLAGEWRFVPDAADMVRGQQVIAPVLPVGTAYPVTHCQTSWIKQPALTPVKPDNPVRVYNRLLFEHNL